MRVTPGMSTLPKGWAFGWRVLYCDDTKCCRREAKAPKDILTAQSSTMEPRPGRHTAMLALCWDDWLSGIRIICVLLLALSRNCSLGKST